MWDKHVYVKLYFLKHQYDKKPIHLVIILENDEWFLLLQVELKIIMINDWVLLTLIFFYDKFN